MRGVEGEVRGLRTVGVRKCCNGGGLKETALGGWWVDDGMNWWGYTV